jgi:Mn-containing catalase
LIAIAGGGGVNLFNSQGNPWTADYLKITGELDVDLRSNIAAEARAKIVYERVINFTTDAGTIDALQFLMTREITHMKAFAIALETMNKPRFMIGKIPPTAGLVDQFFNTSTGIGDDGEIDIRAPWNSSQDLRVVEAPAFQALAPNAATTPSGAVDDHTTSSAVNPEMVERLLVNQLGELLDAESQLVSTLPELAEAARSESLRFAFEQHLEETRQHVERVKEAFRLLGESDNREQCRGMAGLIDEGKDVIEDNEGEGDVAADLALIAAAQKVEHYEISAYGTARTMASQAGLPNVAELFSKSLAEEEIADNLLTQIARELISEARTGTGKGPKHARTQSAAKRN